MQHTLRRQPPAWLVFLLAACALCQARLWHVSPHGDDANDGLNWSTALASPQTAIDRARVGDELWLAQGIYFPDVDANRPLPAASFRLRDGVTLRGGFAGTETSPDERERADRDGNGIVEQWEYRHETILSLPPKVQGSVLTTGATPFECFTCLEGLTVTGGNADHGGGASLHGDVLLQHCDFLDNQATVGGALFATGGVQVEASHFAENSARKAGGAVWLEGENSALTNCVLTRNGAPDAVTAGGGALWLTDRAQLAFCTIAENAAQGPGTGLHAENGALLRNSVVWGGQGHGKLSEIDHTCRVLSCAVTDGGTANLSTGENFGLCATNAGAHGVHANDNTAAAHFACFAAASLRRQFDLTDLAADDQRALPDVAQRKPASRDGDRPAAGGQPHARISQLDDAGVVFHQQPVAADGDGARASAGQVPRPLERVRHAAGARAAPPYRRFRALHAAHGIPPPRGPPTDRTSPKRGLRRRSFCAVLILRGPGGRRCYPMRRSGASSMRYGTIILIHYTRTRL